MCFSATASFTATALLIPMGIYASKIAWLRDARYLPLAVIPLAFGIQQGIECIEWLSLTSNQADMIRFGALGFLFFAYGFWLVCPALGMFILERRAWAKPRLLTIGVIGMLFSASIYLPLWIYPDWLTVVVRQGSIDYQTQMIYDSFLSRDILRLIYLLIVLGPLYLSNIDRIRIFAGLIALSLIASAYFFNYAFVSVWCFWSAILSINIVYIVQSLPRSAQAQKDSPAG
jgi:hypothetical protein